jgi:hypothetical protein
MHYNSLVPHDDDRPRPHWRPAVVADVMVVSPMKRRTEKQKTACISRRGREK